MARGAWVGAAWVGAVWVGAASFGSFAAYGGATLVGPPLPLDTGVADTGAVDTGIADTGWWSVPGPGWDTGCAADTGADTGVDTGAGWWCADRTETLGVVDLTKYPPGEDYADIPKDVADIFAVHCAKCHNPRGRKDTPLDKYDRDLGSFPWKGVTPVKVLEQIKDRIGREDGADGKMPKVPPGKKLTDDQKKKLDKWLDERIDALKKK